MVNKIAWRLNCSGKCDVHSFNKIIRGSYGCDFPWKSIWQAKVPREIAFKKILNVGNLIKKNFTFVDCCCMNKASSESLDDFLLHCSCVRELWPLSSLYFKINGWCQIRLLMCYSAGKESMRDTIVVLFASCCSLSYMERERINHIKLKSLFLRLTYIKNYSWDCCLTGQLPWEVFLVLFLTFILFWNFNYKF